MLERDVEEYLVKRVKALGGEIRKVAWPGHGKAPDRVVMLPAPDAVRWCRGAVGLEHRGFDTSEFSTRRFCIKCGTQDIEAAGRTIWVELKNPETIKTFPSNPHERAQAREHKRLRDVGQRVEVIGTIDGVDELLS